MSVAAKEAGEIPARARRRVARERAYTIYALSSILFLARRRKSRTGH